MHHRRAVMEGKGSIASPMSTMEKEKKRILCRPNKWHNYIFFFTIFCSIPTLLTLEYVVLNVNNNF